MEWEIIPRDEQETLINIDYCVKTINVYTSRKQVGERLKKKIINLKEKEFWFL